MIKLKINKSYIAKLKEMEGLSLTAYKPKGEKDILPCYTIGYGHYGALKGQVITEHQAELLLLDDVRRAYYGLLGLLKTFNLSDKHFTSDRITALVDFIYNLGLESFRKSTLLKMIINAPDDIKIPFEIEKWCYSGKVKLHGLVLRRRYESELWSSNKDNELI